MNSNSKNPQPTKGGFPHYMLKEIYEQPEAVRQTIEACVNSAGHIALPDSGISDEDVRKLQKIDIAASGTSRHAGLAGEFMIERMTGIPVEVDFASQYCYRDPIVEARELAVFISQSGTTVDTVAALHVARSKGAKTLAICNVKDTPLTRDADAMLLTFAGIETSIAATKSFTTQLTALFLLAAHTARVRGSSDASLDAALRLVRKLPDEIQRVLKQNDRCLALAKVFSQYESFLFLGRDIDYPIALEGALKLKEVSYIHAEGYPTGEMKHGPSAMIDESLPLVVLAMRDKSNPASRLRYEKTISNIREICERGTPVIAVISEGDTETPKATPHVIEVPDVPVLLQPILEVVPLQLFAYHIAVLRGRDVDQPRHLSKSVVVE
jgi:glutamine---fructose-6-phosphate transaminase (isomerizing)